MKTTDKAVYTEHFAVATTPNMKQETEDAARVRGVTKSVIVRWALQDWLEANGAAATEQAGEVR
jgi:hypothetical protein